MPSFVGRLSKNSNRPQPAIAELPLSASSGPGPGAGGVAPAENSAAAEAAPQSSPLPSNAALSSSDSFVNAQQNELPPPSHLRASLNLASLQPVASDASSPVFETHQEVPQTPVDAQSQRYGAPLQQQPLPPLHRAGSSPSQQQPQAYAAADQSAGPVAFPEKRSTRKLIRDIFSGSGRNSNDTPPPQPYNYPSSSYDNTAGLARRPSQRISRIALPGTIIRPVPGGKIETSPYEDDFFQPPDFPPPQQVQPLHRGTLHIDEPQAQSDPPLQLFDQPSSQSRQQLLQQHLQYPIYPTQGLQQQLPESRIGATCSATVAQQQNEETISQLSHDSLVIDSDQPSIHQQHSVQSSPAVHYSTIQAPEAASATPKPLSIQTSETQPAQQQHFAMPLPGGAPPPNRRIDADKALRGQAEQPLGLPPGYRQGSISVNPMSPLPATSGQNSAYRGERPSQYEAPAGAEQGRNSPQPSNPDRDTDGDKHFKELLTKYKNVKRLYFDGKSQIELLTRQVEQLQNAVANQRMSQSRTAWDDNEYSTRFSRLNGAINNLSFNIRKDWRSLPPWLETFVSADAVTTGKQEMTAVGRAIVSRWLVEELFNRCFHPGLDPQLSSQLKEIELSIRGNAYTMHSQEEFDALTTKIVNWRMATLDGLQKKLNSPAMGENRTKLISRTTKNLTSYLHQYLNDPPPSGVEGSTSMIAELAVAIATNLPIESRDVAIMYPLPGDVVQPHLMEIEKMGLPMLDSHKSENEGPVDEEEEEEKEEEDGDKDKDKSVRTRGDRSRAGFARDTCKVRFAGFVALEVRGRQVLMKAPVWTV
ncbi:hypothetical protein CDD83_2588 [Cordyceps sp. RAO-2017]|nr:hypothetical protein CDD83_2588 [Cordyceps sp. RAO-2017]